MKSITRIYISLLFVASAILFPTNLIFAQENNKPIIETKTSKEGSSITVTLPEGFSGKVMTSCYDGVCTSTSSPVTDRDIQETKERLEKQRKEIEDFFKQQQKMFDEIFNNEWVWNW